MTSSSVSSSSPFSHFFLQIISINPSFTSRSRRRSSTEMTIRKDETLLCVFVSCNLPLIKTALTLLTLICCVAGGNHGCVEEHVRGKRDIVKRSSQRDRKARGGAIATGTGSIGWTGEKQHNRCFKTLSRATEMKSLFHEGGSPTNSDPKSKDKRH
jgi:hypothetical protein